MPVKPISNARKAVEQQIKKSTPKPKPAMAMTKTYTTTKPKPTTGTKTVTGPTVKVTAPKPAMKTVTGKEVTVTAKRPVGKPNEGGIYLIKKDGKNMQVSKQEYDKYSGPKDKMQRDASGYITQKGSGGKRISIDYTPSKGWKKW